VPRTPKHEGVGWVGLPYLRPSYVLCMSTHYIYIGMTHATSQNTGGIYFSGSMRAWSTTGSQVACWGKSMGFHDHCSSISPFLNSHMCWSFRALFYISCRCSENILKTSHPITKLYPTRSLTLSTATPLANSAKSFSTTTSLSTRTCSMGFLEYVRIRSTCKARQR